MFIDQVLIEVVAGNGGSGMAAFRRESRVPKGGPSGGDGGRGGSVHVVGDGQLWTLLDYTYRDFWEAERGEHGMGANKSGRGGASIVMPVPPGTVVKDLETGLVDFPSLRGGEEVYLCWKLGEARIGYWHGIEEGFAGRKPLDDSRSEDEPPKSSRLQ